MLIQDRVRLIIKANNLTSSEFADRIGVKRSNLSHVLSGRNKPGLEFLSKIIEFYPNVNAGWLLTGTQRTGNFQAELTHSETETNRIIATSAKSSELEPEIDKIVVFYKNGTFSSYEPNVQ